VFRKEIDKFLESILEIIPSKIIQIDNFIDQFGSIIQLNVDNFINIIIGKKYQITFIR